MSTVEPALTIKQLEDIAANSSSKLLGSGGGAGRIGTGSTGSGSGPNSDGRNGGGGSSGFNVKVAYLPDGTYHLKLPAVGEEIAVKLVAPIEGLIVIAYRRTDKGSNGGSQSNLELYTAAEGAVAKLHDSTVVYLEEYMPPYQPLVLSAFSAKNYTNQPPSKEMCCFIESMQAAMKSNGASIDVARAPLNRSDLQDRQANLGFMLKDTKVFQRFEPEPLSQKILIFEVSPFSQAIQHVLNSR